MSQNRVPNDVQQITPEIHEHIFQVSSDGVIFLSADGVIQRINPAALAMLGVTIDKVRLRPASEAFRKNTSLIALTRRQAEKVTNIELAHRRHGIGTLRTFPDGRQLIIIQDVTEKRALESRRESLAHSIAHDLRNPLGAIGGFADLVGRFGDLTPQQEKFLNRIRQTASKIHDMATHLVDLAWIEAGMPMSHQPVQIADVITNVVNDLNDVAQAKDITMVISVQRPMPVVMGDPIRMHMMIYNLLHNAISYTDPEKPVVVHAWSDEKEVFCSIADRGYGIDDDELDRVFDRMYRSSDERVRDTSGGGLGLTIAKTIVNRFGGDIWAASTLNKGSTFTFVIPTAQKH